MPSFCPTISPKAPSPRRSCTDRLLPCGGRKSVAVVRRVRVYRVSSLVIRQRDLGEADRVIILYTAERGKLSAVAKGVKRGRSKLAGGLQLFSHAQVQLAAGRSLEVATQVQPIELFYRLREEMSRYVYACYVAELLDNLVDEGRSDRAVFDLLLATFRALDAGADPPTVVHAFELRLLSRLGYGPEITHCVNCRAPAKTAKAGFSVPQGGVICGRCLSTHRAVALGPAALRAMRELVELPVEQLAARRLSSSVRDELDRILRAFVDYQLSRPLRTVRFLVR